MATIDDMASDFEEQYRNEALEFREPAPYHYGICGNCYEPCKGAYCNAECREDGELRKKTTGGIL